MKKFTKKQRLYALLGGLVLVCGISVGVLYFTGVLPSQSQGMLMRWELAPTAPDCVDKDCPCHTGKNCNSCPDCVPPKEQTPDPNQNPQGGPVNAVIY